MNRKTIIILFLVLLLMLIPVNISNANGKINLTTDFNKVKNGETFNINITSQNISVAAMTLYIYFNSDIVEYISGPETSNYSNNRIIYTWYSNKGIEENIEKEQIASFKFKAKEKSTAAFSVFGELYDIDGNKIDVKFNNVQIEIYDEEKLESNVSDSSSYLSEMRINKEGITPIFDKNITQYYFLTQEKIKELQVTAIPENSEATVNITGNSNLKKGLNKIEIDVRSKDNKSNTKYIINATISDNLENDNSNLENLAIENYYLTPEFDNNITNYKIEVGNNISDLNILAIPENEGAKVEIKGNKNLKNGNNKIEVVVTSKNGNTIKNYIINAYKRNEQEDKIIEQEKDNDAERLSVILEETEKESRSEQSNEKNKIFINKNIIIITVLIILLVILIIIKIKHKSSKD